MKLLIIKTSSMGDIIHTLPAITDAAQHIPNLQIDWVVEECFAEIPLWHPAITNVIPVALRRWRKQPLKTVRSNEWRNFYRQLRATEYDFVIDAQGLIKSAFLTQLARGIRCGFTKYSARESLAALVYQQHYEIKKQQHAITRTRELFAAILNYSFNPAIVNYGIDTQRIPMSNFKLPENYSVFITNTSRSDKRWPAENWRALLQHCQQNNLSVVLPSGTGAEIALTQSIAKDFANTTLLPSCSLKQLLEILAYANFIVSVDTGLSHLAAALAKPTIVIYQTSDPTLIGTQGEHQQHLIDPTPNEVWEKLYVAH
ncbi:MAG: lipopolysaccharide heptosyltransferase I [Gammaproteobacteria bacterium]|nr:lipopolysaccharide heptosyltransferase I [Gammaproteobacteria bacterium]